jgi:hypothetical protein
MLRGGSGRFNISFFVGEPEEGGNINKDCCNFHGSNSNQRPEIVKDSVDTTETPNDVGVPYRAVATLGHPLQVAGRSTTAVTVSDSEGLVRMRYSLAITLNAGSADGATDFALGFLSRNGFICFPYLKKE